MSEHKIEFDLEFRNFADKVEDNLEGEFGDLVRAKKNEGPPFLFNRVGFWAHYSHGTAEVFDDATSQLSKQWFRYILVGSAGAFVLFVNAFGNAPTADAVERVAYALTALSLGGAIFTSFLGHKQLVMHQQSVSAGMKALRIAHAIYKEDPERATAFIEAHHHHRSNWDQRRGAYTKYFDLSIGLIVLGLVAAVGSILV